MRTEPNDPVTVDAYVTELMLADCPDVIGQIVAMSRTQDTREDTRHEARLALKEQARRDLESATRDLAAVQRQLEDPNAALDKRRIEKRVKQLTDIVEKKRDALRKVTESKPSNFILRRHTSRILEGIAKLIGKGPQVLRTVDVPKAYAKADGLTLIREAIAEKEARRATLYDARLPFAEAFGRYESGVNATVAKAGDAQLGEFSRVRSDSRGNFRFDRVELPPEFFMHAIRAFVLSYGEDRLRKFYDRLEARGEEFIAMTDRERELKAITADIADLEVIEGELIRRAVMAGNEVIIRPTMSIDALLGLEPDPAAEFESPKPQIIDITQAA
jgi:hypothetical protein